MYLTNIFHNTIIETFSPLLSLTVSVSNGNIGLLENKLDIEKGVIITIEQLVILMKFSSWASRVTERHTRGRATSISIFIGFLLVLLPLAFVI